MLEAIGASSVEELFSDIPSAIRRGEMAALPSQKSEYELRSFFHKTSQKNVDPLLWKSYLGAGCYDHYIPSIINPLVTRGEFLTSYTPYQAEISQGTLQAIFEFQSMIANLSGMEVANASMYDGASACAEAVLMSLRVNPGKHVYLSKALHPDYRLTVISYLSDYDVEIHELEIDTNGQTKVHDFLPETSCVVIGQPNFYGVIESLKELEQSIHGQQALFVVATQEALSLAMIEPPGYAGADIFAGEGQSLGVEMNYGGPHVGLFATKQKYVRQMPGRLVGKTVDEAGLPGYVLTLSTREQHIRREKATSNICTNNALCALKACIYMACMGEKGLMEVAHTNYVRAHQLSEGLTSIPSIKKSYAGEFFNEFVITLPMEATKVIEKFSQHAIHPGIALSSFDPKRTHELLITVTETKTEEDIEQFVSCMKGVL